MPLFSVNDGNILHLVTEGQRHSAEFSQDAWHRNQSLNYISGDDIFLHVIFRPSDGCLVLNDFRSQQWGQEFLVSVSNDFFRNSVGVDLIFSKDGLDVRINSGERISTGRWRPPSDFLVIKAPDGITVQVYSESAEGRRIENQKNQKITPISWLGSSVRNSHFAEICATQHPVSDLVRLALHSGAASATSIDNPPVDSPYWRDQKFKRSSDDFLRERWRFKSADLEDPYFAEQAGSFDYVACSRLMHNEPNMLSALINLRRITRQQCHISAIIVPPIIEGVDGFLDLRDAGALCALTISDRANRLIADYLRSHSDASQTRETSSMNENVNADRCWWILTEDAFERLAVHAGFQVVASKTGSGTALHSMILEPAWAAP